MESNPADVHLERKRLIVVHGWGPDCNRATKAARPLAALGFRLNEAIGGIDHWNREGDPLEGAVGAGAPLAG